VDTRRIARLAIVAGLIASLSLAGAGPVAGAKPAKTATVSMSFTVTDGRCHPTETATWSGYQVNHVRFLGYLEGRSGNDATWLDTKSFPQGVSETSGTMTSTSWMVARPGEGWYAYALFRSNGGARLAEAWSPVVHAPAECLYP
jgi:hypothetical protein